MAKYMSLPKVEIYCDGAASRNGLDGAIAGWAWCLLVDEELTAENSGRIIGGTNNQGELTAVIKALEFVEENAQNTSYPITLYSDSSYCVKGVTEWMYNWKEYNWTRNPGGTAELKNKELWQALFNLSQNLNIKFYWIKGHGDSYWNNYVDKMAVKETKNDA